MSTAGAVRARPRAPRLAAPARPGPAGPALVAACVGLAALSLLAPWALAFDPMAWVVWGREAARLALDTSSGPSWKPLPVLVTTPLALTGDAAPALWLIVARAGGLLALAGAFRLGARLGGTAAGAGAVAVVALGPWWLYNTALGNSEGLLAAAVLWALIAHLDGRPGAAVALGVVAGLLRPEAWPFLLAYGLWAWRRGLLSTPAAGLALAALALPWLGPDLLGVGGALAASHAALGPASPGSAALSDVPPLAVVVDAVVLLGAPACAAALLALLGRPSRPVRGIAAGALAWVLLVAVETALGYAGNPRYLAAAAAAFAVVAGVGAARAGALGAAVLAAATLAVSAGDLRTQLEEVATRAAIARSLPGAIAAGGGRDALLACGTLRTAPRQRPHVAWELDVPMVDLDLPPRAPATVLQAAPFAGRPRSPSISPRFERIAIRGAWSVWTSCA